MLKFITTAQTAWREFEIKTNSFFMFDSRSTIELFLIVLKELSDSSF